MDQSAEEKPSFTDKLPPLERPGWTISFGLIWVAWFVAMIFMHVAVVELQHSVAEMPSNLLKGLSKLFGFHLMREEALNVQDAATKGLQLCDPMEDRPDVVQYFCEEAGPMICLPTANNTAEIIEQFNVTADTTKHHESIKESYKISFSKMVTFGDDPYLALPEINVAGEMSKGMQKILDILDPTDNCCIQVPAYCTLYSSGKDLLGQAGKVDEDVDKLTSEEDNEALKAFRDLSVWMGWFHVLPYVMLLSMGLYAALWYLNGACCCCRGGSCLYFFMIIVPEILFWFLGFLLMFIFCIMGYAASALIFAVQIDFMPNKPTMQVLIEHLESTYPDFWDKVFTQLISGLFWFRTASTVFLFMGIFMICHSACFCCCRPYAVVDTKVIDISAEEDEEAGDRSPKKTDDKPSSHGQDDVQAL